MIVWFDRFGNRREQIYEDGTLTAGSYAFDKLYVYWDNEENFISRSETQLQGTVVDFKLADGTEVEGVVTSIVAKEMPYIKDVDYRFFKAKKIYRFIECAIPSSVTAQNGLVTAQIKVMVNSSLVKTLVGVDFVVDGHKATNRDISDADYRNILANYMPYTGGTFTGYVSFAQGFSFDSLELQSLKIGELGSIIEDTYGGEPYLSLGEGNNVYVREKLLVDGDAQFNGNLTDGDVYIGVANIESKTNKTSSLSSASTNAQYPTAKAVFDIKTELVDRIENIESRGRFLSAWDAETGLPETFPIIPDGAEYPYTYEYRAGDYFIVSNIPDSGTAYKPSGSSMTKQSASSSWTVGKAAETNSVAVNSLYVFDGTTWNLIASGGEVATWGSITGNINSQSDLKNALDAKANASNAAKTDAANTFTQDQTMNGKIYFVSSSSFVGLDGGDLAFQSSSGQVKTWRKFVPAVSGIDLGSSSSLWNDVYVSGKLKDGTNEVSIADIVNSLDGKMPIIDPPSSTTLTDAEIEIFKVGCIVKGDFLGLHNAIFLPNGKAYGDWNLYGLCAGCIADGSGVSFYTYNIGIGHNKKISLSNEIINTNFANFALKNVGSINGKTPKLYTKTEDLSSTSITLTANVDTEYVYGALSSLNITFSNGTSNGQEISIMWESGSTATTLTLNGTNKAHGSIVPSANMYCELNCKWYRGKWVILYSEVSSL